MGRTKIALRHLDRSSLLVSHCFRCRHVIGAGPAGSATALFLARAGCEVTLLDRAVFPRDKPCGEYLTPGAVNLLRDEIGILPEADGGRRNPVDTRETVVPHQFPSIQRYDGRIWPARAL